MKVLAQRQTEKVLDDGEVHSVVSVAVLVGGMGPFTMDVPIDEFHEENVLALARDLEYRVGTVRYSLENRLDEHGAGHGGDSPAQPHRPPAAAA